MSVHGRLTEKSTSASSRVRHSDERGKRKVMGTKDTAGKSQLSVRCWLTGISVERCTDLSVRAECL